MRELGQPEHVSNRTRVGADPNLARQGITPLGDDKCPFCALNEYVGSLSNPAAIFLAWPPDIRALARLPQRFGDVSVEELAEEWDMELEALARRARLRIVRSDELDRARTGVGSRRLSDGLMILT